MAITHRKSWAPEEHSLGRMCPLVVTPYLYLKEAADTAGELQTLNLHKLSQCHLKARVFSWLFLITFYHMNPCRGRCSAMGTISSCPVCPRTKVFMSPLGH